MSYSTRDIDRIARSITSNLERDLINAGLFYRIFYRCKTSKSLKRKLLATHPDGSDKYDGTTKFIRDVIGVRINLYFVEDLLVLTKFIKEKYRATFVEETIDQNTATEFKPTRINLIYKVPEDYVPEFKEVVKDHRIDQTFELQLRTVFSEGWHEVEHDLRYKCPNDWNDHPDLSRTFNGILASLETHEWSIIQMFERLSYSHYKQRNYSAMIRTKLRMRFEEISLEGELSDLINSEDSFLKDFFKLDRNNIMDFLLAQTLSFPPTLENIIYLINYFFINNEAVIKITPPILIREFKRIQK